MKGIATVLLGAALAAAPALAVEAAPAAKSEAPKVAMTSKHTPRHHHASKRHAAPKGKTAKAEPKPASPAK